MDGFLSLVHKYINIVPQTPHPNSHILGPDSRGGANNMNNLQEMCLYNNNIYRISHYIV